MLTKGLRMEPVNVFVAESAWVPLACVLGFCGQCAEAVMRGAWCAIERNFSFNSAFFAVVLEGRKFFKQQITNW